VRRLLNVQPARFLTAAATIRREVDLDAARLACERWASQRGGVAVFTIERDSGAGPSGRRRQLVEISRLWLEPPTRWRHEIASTDGAEKRIVVVDRPRWWTYSPAIGAMTNDGYPTARPAPTAYPYEGLFEPDSLTRSLSVSSRVRERWNERDVLRLLALPGDRLHGDLPRCADHYDIKVDVEHNVVRELIATTDGEVFTRIEMIDLVFGIPLEPQTFRIDLPPGVRYRPPPPSPAAPWPPTRQPPGK
jgi:hypothetical protein